MNEENAEKHKIAQILGIAESWDTASNPELPLEERVRALKEFDDLVKPGGPLHYESGDLLPANEITPDDIRTLHTELGVEMPQ